MWHILPPLSILSRQLDYSRVVGHINEDVVHRARLILGWVTVSEFNISVCSQPHRLVKHVSYLSERLRGVCCTKRCLLM